MAQPRQHLAEFTPERGRWLCRRRGGNVVRQLVSGIALMAARAAMFICRTGSSHHVAPLNERKIEKFFLRIAFSLRMGYIFRQLDNLIKRGMLVR
jgi:hypothetical protein